MQRIADIGYLVATGGDRRELNPGTDPVICFSDASNVAVADAMATGREVSLVVLSLKGTRAEFAARRAARRWKRTARTITVKMIANRREWEKAGL